MPRKCVQPVQRKRISRAAQEWHRDVVSKAPLYSTLACLARIRCSYLRNTYTDVMIPRLIDEVAVEVPTQAVEPLLKM
jgi:hypothetical protein